MRLKNLKVTFSKALLCTESIQYDSIKTKLQYQMLKLKKFQISDEIFQLNQVFSISQVQIFF